MLKMFHGTRNMQFKNLAQKFCSKFRKRTKNFEKIQKYNVFKTFPPNSSSFRHGEKDTVLSTPAKICSLLLEKFLKTFRSRLSSRHVICSIDKTSRPSLNHNLKSKSFQLFSEIVFHSKFPAGHVDCSFDNNS